MPFPASTPFFWASKQYSKGMNFPRFVQAEQSFPNRAIANIEEHIRQELASSGIAQRVPKGARIAIGVGSRGISNIARITKAVVNFWKEHGAQPFIIPAMGSHGAATAEGQSDVLAITVSTKPPWACLCSVHSRSSRWHYA